MKKPILITGRLQEWAWQPLFFLPMDVTSGADIQQAFRQVSGVVGDNGLYALINKAGIMYTAPFEYADQERAREMIEVNLIAPYKISQTFIPLLKKHNAGNTVKARV